MSTSGQHRLTSAQAISIAKRARKLLRAGRITHRQFVILDCLLWSCRNPVTGAIVVSYTALQKLCHVSRETIAGALRVLGELGVLTKIKLRVRVLWGGSVASRQATNAYILHPRTEFGSRPVRIITIERQEAHDDCGRIGQGPIPDLLAARRAAWEAGLVGIGAGATKAW
jgi:hypothetical protein